MLCSTRMEFIWPKQCKQQCSTSPLKRSRLTNNLNSLKIFDLESTDDACEKKMKKTKTHKKTESNFIWSFNSQKAAWYLLGDIWGASSLFLYLHVVCFSICMTYLQSIFAGICGNNGELWVEVIVTAGMYSCNKIFPAYTFLNLFLFTKCYSEERIRFLCAW